MICPQCATRNELGSQRCRACRRPFTHEALQAASPSRGMPHRRPTSVATPTTGWVDADHHPAPALIPPDTSVWSGRAVRAGSYGRRKRPHGCLLTLSIASIIAVALLVSMLLASSYIIKPIVRDAAIPDLRAGIRNEVSAQLAQQIVDAPEGELVITDDEINQRLAAGGDLGPIDDVQVTITPEVITVDLSAYGLSGTYQSTVRAENGSVVLDGGSLDGPLAFVIPNDELADATNAQIAASLSAAGYHVESVTMQDGAITLTVVR